MRPLFLLILLLYAYSPCESQNTDNHCRDIVRLRSGSTLQGKILSYSPEGELLIHTSNNLDMHIPSSNIRWTKQKCPSVHRDSVFVIGDSFRERGWYHFTRLEFLPGKDGIGYGVQHSSGFKFNRFVSAGAGIAAEEFEIDNSGASTYPVFGEIRSFLLARKISPFYALGFGYGFSAKTGINNRIVDGPAYHWKGGWLFQSEFGYRIGAHAMVQFGIRLQRKTLYWKQFWSGTTGKDDMLYKRFEIGLGLLI